LKSSKFFKFECFIIDFFFTNVNSINLNLIIMVLGKIAYAEDFDVREDFVDLEDLDDFDDLEDLDD